MRRVYAFDRRRDRRPLAWLVVLTLLLIGVRAASMVVVSQPGYTDAYYYASVAGRVVRGEGLSADFVWNFLEAPRFASLPIPSHRFWMPLPTLLQAAGIALIGGPLGDFRAAQVAIVTVAAAIPVVTYAAARMLGAGLVAALAAAAVVGLGGALAPAWVSLDAFGIAALLGTLFFLAFARAAQGSVGAGALAGLLVGLLYLSRAEAALFGLALLWLAGRRRTARAGAVGAAIALAIGLGWLVRGISLGFPGDLFARAVLLVRYEDFFALHPPALEPFLGAPLDVLGAKAGALVTNAVTALVTVLLAPVVPLALAVRGRWHRLEVRAFVGLLLTVYVAQSVVFTPHSVRGSFFHSIAAFFPFAVALASVGTEDLFHGSTAGMRRMVWGTTVAAFGVISVFSLGQWDVDFNTPYRARVAALPLLPPGPLIVTDAAAWRWISGRPAVLAPADGPSVAACAAEVYLSTTLVLEPAHFSRYDELYAAERTDLFTRRAERNGIRVYSVREDQRCIIAAQP
ncbi:MAG: hypothetical protein HYS77_06955 [Candidatus Rokubacteria bacterium]|nr:hypothetical protein [Candidatus Rokubacteria bacterium]